MSSETLEKLEDPGLVAPILVSWCLALSDEELQHHLPRYLRGCASTTYGFALPIPSFDLSSFRERALELRPCKLLSMNDIFATIGLLDSFQLSPDQLQRGAGRHLVECMEFMIEVKLSEKAYLESQQDAGKKASKGKNKKARKSRADKRRRYLRKKEGKAAKRAKRNFRSR